jgi:ribosomal protein L11 methyltransferase
MANYVQVNFENITSEQSEILIAMLSEKGYNGFEEVENNLLAFINSNEFEVSAIDTIVMQLGIKYTTQLVGDKNWNEVWESNFQPVIIDDFAAVRAYFHAPINTVRHEIIITPKMSFGTGHHATTYLMMQQMQHIDCKDRKVFDFGTGTGVLAILAEKLGTANVVAIDNDEWSIENTLENISTNRCKNIAVQLAHSAALNGSYDIILANINRNVLLDNMVELGKQLVKKGKLLMSGLLVADEQVIKESATAEQLHHKATWQRNGWICILFEKH